MGATTRKRPAIYATYAPPCHLCATYAAARCGRARAFHTLHILCTYLAPKACALCRVCAEYGSSMAAYDA